MPNEESSSAVSLEVIRLRAENERLRKALQSLADDSRFIDDFDDEWGCSVCGNCAGIGVEVDHKEYCKIGTARAALGEEQQP